jgi:hypothetical protein
VQAEPTIIRAIREKGKIHFFIPLVLRVLYPTASIFKNKHNSASRIPTNAP